MNPDKLFDYLDGKLSQAERIALEERLLSDEELRRELAVARQIHAYSRDSREVTLPAEPDTSERGRKLARRIGVAFILLMALNVGIGLWFIARYEAKNPNRALLEAQMRQQLAQSLQHAATTTLSPAPLGVIDIRLSAAPGRVSSVADQVAAVVRQLGGTAAKGIPEEHRVGVLVDLPANRETEFRQNLAAIEGTTPPARAPTETAAGEGTTSFSIEIVEAAAAPK